MIFKKANTSKAQPDYKEMIMASGSKIDDIYSLELLQSLINGYPFLPFTTFSLRPFCLNYIINDIVINCRKCIIEFGAGLSTIIIGRLIKRNNLNATVKSIEHNEEWAALINRMLAIENLQDIVDVVHAPLKVSKISEGGLWYDPEVIDNNIADKQFDIVIIDGPPAWEKGKEKARYPAVPFIKNRLGSSFSIYLDDAERGGEQAVIKSWKDEYNFDFSITGGTLAHYGMNSFETKPFWPASI